jgi:alginate O-acetyltransferase complex protein AlgI
MVFSSTVFLFLFLPVVLTGYFLLPRSWRNAYLLVASLLFYAWGEGFYLLIMLMSIAMNYVGGRLIHALPSRPRKKLALSFVIAMNLLLLGSFKYANFVVDNLNLPLAALGLGQWSLDPVHLPIGISFFTFQAMSYLVDIYRGDAKAQRNPVNTALYIAMFPQLIAGPIVRYQHIHEQINQRKESFELIAGGIALFIVGLGKKVLIANPMGEIADNIFAIPVDHLTFELSWIGAIAYTLQIYFDFSGYSDMAIGLGRIFGFRFLINFDYPYIARSMREFWRRWHISLSSWFRDYLYVPLGGNRNGPWRTCFNLLVVFLLCGLWHGASWNFVIWGLMHGAFLALERSPFGGWMSHRHRVVQHVYVLAVVVFAWVIFRADNLDYALAYWGAMSGFGPNASYLFYPLMYLNVYSLTIAGAGIVGSTPFWPVLREKFRNARPAPALDVAATAFLLAIVALSAMHLAVGTHNPFIYFRF